MRRDETPLRRVTNGQVRWVARYTNEAGQRRSAGTYEKKGACKRPAPDGRCCAQHAIYHAYEHGAPTEAPRTIGAYVTDSWLRAHPRSERTNVAYRSRFAQMLPADLGDGPLGEMPFGLVARSHALRLLDVLLTDQGRTAVGAKSMVATVNAMWQDALDDEWAAAASPFLRLRVRADDPRVQKASRVPRVWSWEEMHALCAAAGPHEAMLRLMSDCGLRIGEVLPLHRRDLKLGGGACDEAPTCLASGAHVHVRWKAWRLKELPGTKQGARRVAPVAPALEALLRALPSPLHPDGLLFPTRSGKLWWEMDWRRSVWALACARSGVDALPHELRHSWVSYMRAAGIDAADAAAAAGHSVDVASRTYTHPLGLSFDAMRKAVG